MNLILNERTFGWSYALCCKVMVTIDGFQQGLFAEGGDQ